MLPYNSHFAPAVNNLSTFLLLQTKGETGNAMQNVTKKQMHTLLPVSVRLSVPRFVLLCRLNSLSSVGVMNPLGQGNEALEAQSTNEFFM